MGKLSEELKFKAKSHRIQSAWGFLIKKKNSNNISSYYATEGRLGSNVHSFIQSSQDCQGSTIQVRNKKREK